MGSWQHREVQIALDRQAREPDLPVIPTLLPGLDDEPTGFLSLQTWIDLRADPDDPEQLQTLIAAIRREVPEDTSSEIKARVCPYRGLLPFREQDSGFFFGREQASQDLLTKVQQHPVVAVVGRSGSGKSSLVFAGLFPKLRRSPNGTAWDMMAVRPGEDPLAALVRKISPPPSDASPIQRDVSIGNDVRALRDGSASLPRLIRTHLNEKSGAGTDRLLLYVDQWEELYTQSRRAVDETERAQKQADVTRFIDLLLQATEDSPLTLVFTVRADFYDNLLRHERLTGIAQDQQISLGPLTEEQLQACIEQPARKVGLRLEEGLVERIVRDVGGDEGKLPLLEYALKGTWENSRNAWSAGATRAVLTHGAYEIAGRVEAAIAGKADAVYSRLTDAQKDAARRLFLSLVTPGEGQADTRAIARVPDDPAIEQVVAAFSDRNQRLLITGRDPARGRIAEISHEALIRNWITLRDWISANREILRTRERIGGQMKRWEDEREPDDLLLQRGRALEEGRQLLSNHGDVLVDDIRLYLERSIEYDRQLLDAEQRDREEEQRRELARERQLREAQEQITKRTRLGLVAASILLLITVGAGGYAWQQAVESEHNLNLAAGVAKGLALEVARKSTASADELRGFLQQVNLIDDKMIERGSTSTEVWQLKATALNDIADTYFPSGQFDKSKQHINESIDITQKLITIQPTNAECQNGFATNCKRNGTFELASGNLLSARDFFRMAIESWEDMAHDHPDNPWLPVHIWINYIKIGDLLAIQNAQDSALESYRASYKTAEARAGQDQDPSWKIRLQTSSDRIRGMPLGRHFKGGDLNGTYAVYGTNPDDQEYVEYYGEAAIVQNGETYYVTEKIADEMSEGEAFMNSLGQLEWQYGPTEEGMAVYRVVSDGVLAGYWGNGLGQEILVRIK